ncbi:hypothetical protein SDJN02_21287, partial [Cucurbita argyrosperma subsp. argyrosperma]
MALNSKGNMREIQSAGDLISRSPEFLFTIKLVFETDEALGNNRAGRVMGFCISPLGTPARLLWSTSFFRHKLMIF